MSYIGKTPAQGNFVKLDAISCTSTNTYNLTSDSVAFVPETALHMMVSLNGVIQAPLTSFSISGSTITFLPSSGTLSSSDTIDFILVLGNVLDIGTPSDSTVTNAKTNFVSSSSSAGLSIKGDGTNDGTGGKLQLNCSANSHGIKLESPAHSAGQGYTLKFPTGNVTAGKVLKVDSVSGSGTTGVGQLSFGDGGGLVKLSSSTLSSNVTNVTFDTITSTYSSYLLQGSIVATDAQNSSVDLYLRNGGSDVGSGNTGVAIYQGELINRAGSDTPVGDVLNGTNAYLRLPCEREIYGGSIFSFTVQFSELNAGLLTGQTNLTSPITRLIRNGWYSYSYQSVSASDFYGGHGWFRMDNPNANLTNITGIKINSGASNFVKHNVQLYGYVK